MGTGDNRSLPGDSIVFEPGSRTLERIEENLDTPDVDPAALRLESIKVAGLQSTLRAANRMTPLMSFWRAGCTGAHRVGPGPLACPASNAQYGPRGTGQHPRND
jgi:hypothetical protein